MKNPWMRSLLFAGLLGSVSLPGLLEAQQRRPGPRTQRPEMEAQVRQRFQQMVLRELGLDAQQGEAMAVVVEEFQGPRMALNQRQRILQRRMAGTGAILSQREAEEVLAELASVKQAEVDLLLAEQVRLLEILSPPQLVRYYTLREQFAGRIRQLRENRPGGGGPLRPGGGGTSGVWPMLQE